MKPVGFSGAWKHVDPIDDESLANLVKILGRPGGSMKIPKADIAALIIRLQQAEAWIEHLESQ